MTTTPSPAAGAVAPPTAELVPSADERALGQTVRDVLDDLCPLEQVRIAAEQEPGFDPKAWRALTAEVGLSGLTVPERWGGLGMGESAANVVHEELGHSLYPGPYLAGTLAVAAILAAGEAPAERWLPAIATGERTATVAVAGRNGQWATDSVHAVRGRQGWRLSGQRWFVMAGHAADVVLVAAQGPAGPSMFVVESGSGHGAQPMPGLDLTRRMASLTFVDTPAELVGEDGAGAAVLDALGRRLRLGAAAEAAGGLRWCLDTCVDYVGTRQQFGRVIGGFQAVAHACVDLLAAAQSASAAARWAAVAAENRQGEAELAGHVAALRAGLDYRTQTEAAVHLLGGIGFTWEHDMHLYYRRARSALALAGGPAAHRRAIADLAGL